MDVLSLLNQSSGSGEPVVLAPGGLSGWTSWIGMAERLSEDRQVVRVQLRSVELAEAGKCIPDDYDTATETDALLATVDELGLERFDLVGWSYGGHVALAFTLDHPERIHTLTVIEPPAVWILGETDHDLSSLAATERFDRSLTGREVTTDDLQEFLLRAGFGQPGDDFALQPSWPTWVRNRQALSINGTIWDYRGSIERLQMLRLPILAVKGTETTPELAAIVDAIVATAPQSTLLELPGDHASHLQNAERFLQMLRAHLAEGRDA